MKKNIAVGGQAVIEGVMMRGNNGIAIAVRKSDGNIVVDKLGVKSNLSKNIFLSLPIIRGFVALIESLVIGIKSLNYSASFFEEEEEDQSKFEKFVYSIFKERTEDIIIGISLIFSMLFATGLFFILPTFFANVFRKINVSNFVVLNIIEGIIRVSIFLIYLFLISKMDDIYRVFQYHGAEHKTIFCYENQEELTIENVKKYGTLHPRCGTNFLFLVMIVSIILFSLTGWGSIKERIIYRLILLPLVSGITYEIIKWVGKSESIISKILSYPGLMLQKLTTRNPDDSQLEVAIKALKVAEGIDN